MGTKLHIGLDLDNTIIDFDEAFGAAGVETGLLAPGHALATKEQVKAHLRSGPDGDTTWMRLQGQVYGRYIGMARLFEGVGDFLKTARGHGARISIVSHKTRHGHFDPDRINLWEAARDWLEGQGFFAADGFDLDPGDVHFCETRARKIERIGETGCRAFVDDLAEVLNDPSFPSNVARIWFAPHQSADAGNGLTPHRSWAEIAAAMATEF
ncbi:MAG: hypothetical protein MI824_23750 [Hyphomicrobiales bacterium]|nr:hypothetical protein [Hyphomicrobiales bacterium]